MAKVVNNVPVIVAAFRTALSQVVRKTKEVSEMLWQMKLGNMFPCHTLNNFSHSAFRHTVAASQACHGCATAVSRNARFIDRSDGSHIIVSQFRKMLVLASRVTFWLRVFHASPFSVHVLHIVGVGSQKQVIGAYATGVITVMAHKKSLRNSTVGQFVRHAVRYIGMGLIVFTATVERPIAEWGLCSTCPNPTSIGVAPINLCPKSLLKRLALTSERRCACTGTESTPATVEVVLLDRKFLVANNALTNSQHIKTPSSLPDYTIVRNKFQRLSEDDL